MSRKTESPAIPEGGEDAVQALKESMEVGLGRRGNPLETFVTFRDLVDAGFASTGTGRGRLRLLGNGQGGSGGESYGPVAGEPGGPIDIGENDLTKPPRPQNVRARGISMSSIGLSWDGPNYNNHQYAEIFASKNDNWAHIVTTFDVSRPHSRGNRTPYFMGTSTGSMFLHRDLGDTVPSLNLEFDIQSIVVGETSTILYLADTSSFTTTDTVYLSGPTGWENAGYSGNVTLVSGAYIRIDTPVASNAMVAGATVLRQPTSDELEAALSPNPIYYWVRFVSQANVVGDPQSEAGAVGTVMLNPEQILNVLTGRIRSSNLASDLLTPINYVRGPLIQRLNLNEYNFEELDKEVGKQIGRINDLDFDINNDEGRLKAVEGYFVRGNFGDAQAFSVWVNDLRINVTNDGSTLENIENWQSVFDPNGDAVTQGARLSEIRTSADAGGAMAEDINALEASYLGAPAWTTKPDGTPADGVDRLARALTQRFVTATDTQALSWISSQLSVQYNSGQWLNNEIRQVVSANKDSINNAITLKVQSDNNGVLTAAGFGIGLQGNPNDPGSLRSTFAVSADQFAIMGAGNGGRAVLAIRDNVATANEYELLLAGNRLTPDQLALNTEVAVAFDSTNAAMATAFRNRTYEIIGVGWYRVNAFDASLRDIGLGIGQELKTVRIRLPDNEGRPYRFDDTWDTIESAAVFPDYNIPFIVNTDSSVPVVGIRGKLVVNGMIHANEAEITGLLRSNEIWAESITNFGLLRTQSLIGDTIATPRIGGWALRLGKPNFKASSTTVFEFSRWGTGEDSSTVNPDQLSSYPQLTTNDPIDTAFAIGTKGLANNRKSFGYLKGSLTVGGGGRIYTRTDPLNPIHHFVQMDETFPLMVMDKNKLDPQNTGGRDWDTFNYTAALTNNIRKDALFWIHRDGSAGFNTSSDSIFVGDTPMEPPSGGGVIKVITRLDDGATSGVGRVHVTADFSQTCNRYSPHSQIGASYYLMLARTDLNYASNQYYNRGEAYAPSSRSGVAMPNGVLMLRDVSGPILDFLDAHFLIIRSSSENLTDSQGRVWTDPGHRAWKDWEKAHENAGIYVFNHFYTAATPDHRFFQGAVTVPAGGNYRVMIVAVERFSAGGNFIWGPIIQSKSNEPGGCIGITQGSFVSQQASTRTSGGIHVVKNNRSGGSGSTYVPPGDTGGGDESGGAGLNDVDPEILIA